MKDLERYYPRLTQCGSMCPEIQLKRGILDFYENEKAKNLNALTSNQSRLAITIDLWTADTQTKGYMVVTATLLMTFG